MVFCTVLGADICTVLSNVLWIDFGFADFLRLCFFRFLFLGGSFDRFVRYLLLRFLFRFRLGHPGRTRRNTSIQGEFLTQFEAVLKDQCLFNSTVCVGPTTVKPTKTVKRTRASTRLRIGFEHHWLSYTVRIHHELVMIFTLLVLSEVTMEEKMQPKRKHRAWYEITKPSHAIYPVEVKV